MTGGILLRLLKKTLIFISDGIYSNRKGAYMRGKIRVGIFMYTENRNTVSILEFYTSFTYDSVSDFCLLHATACHTHTHTWSFQHVFHHIALKIDSKQNRKGLVSWIFLKIRVP